MTDVHWTDTAMVHLDGIYAYIAADSERYALRTVDRITRRSMQIAEQPFSGRMVPEVAVFHGARRFPWSEILA